MRAAIRAVVFDVGETLVDETREWGVRADRAGITRLTLFGVLGALIERGEHHRRVWEVLGAPEPEPVERELSDFYPDAVPCLAELRAAGLRVAVAGNMPAAYEALLAPFVHATGSSARWGVAKPSPAFFARVLELAGQPAGRVAYVGDRVDNDVLPAKAAGMLAVHVRRGPWGHLQDPAAADVRVSSLRELLPALAQGSSG